MDLTQFSPSSALITVIVLSLAPFMAVMLTSFTKIVVVLSLLRNALGTQQIPPNVVLNGLALILTIYVMYPVGQAMLAQLDGRGSFTENVEDLLVAADASKEPLRDFMLKHSNEREREFFLSTIKRMVEPGDADQLTNEDFIVVVPAFTISELTSAFQIGFLIFLPFIIIDLVISNILMAMGMMMLSPTTISLPFKLLLFVLIEGWSKLAQGLVLSYV
ncbi:type III secretion system export apparatus subunit SctR [Granulosicoccus antarcticus]|uniref:Flagellar biosynthetic protein FliP n=1 Tax=Granulosicoccus antarcticus IMCC3135 TaxID=1192854 RepID=A0A2Z2NGV6_9GAMM|nr:type III secretion system export apparatus subunit SctR [Granulosicoccus antarcticus]ASJ70512.1 Flagellar biosynthetic protein FliP [Granulosicoccus antarcticus IMCC3135]